MVSIFILQQNLITKITNNLPYVFYLILAWLVWRENIENINEKKTNESSKSWADLRHSSNNNKRLSFLVTENGRYRKFCEIYDSSKSCPTKNLERKQPN